MSNAAISKARFADLLLDIEKADEDYSTRETLVYTALAWAKALGYPAGIRIDKDLEDSHLWPVVCIDLPDVGEVSWHCPGYQVPFKQYDTKEKYDRARRYRAMWPHEPSSTTEKKAS